MAFSEFSVNVGGKGNDWKEFEKYIAKEIQKGVGASNTTNYTNGIWTTTVGNPNGYVGMICGHTDARIDFIPTKVIYNCPATICFFPDGTKEIVKCAPDEAYVQEIGVMACIMKKIFKSRRQFLKLVASGDENVDAIFERNAHNATLHRKQR